MFSPISIPRDILGEILNILYIRDDVRTLANLARTCKYLHGVVDLEQNQIQNLRRKRIRALRRSNPTWDFIKTHFASAYMGQYTIHETVTAEIILAHPKIRWDWPNLTANPNITLEMLQKIIEKLNLQHIRFVYGSRSAITPHEFDKYVKGGERNINILTLADAVRKDNKGSDMFEYYQRYGAITIREIRTNPQLPWNPEFLLINNCLPVEFILKHFDVKRLSLQLLNRINTWKCKHALDKLRPCAHIEDGSKLAYKGIDMQMVLAAPDYPWDWWMLSKYANILFREKLEHRDLPWAWVECFKYTYADELGPDHPNVKFELMAEDGLLTAEVVNDNKSTMWMRAEIMSLPNISVADMDKMNFGLFTCQGARLNEYAAFINRINMSWIYAGWYSSNCCDCDYLHS